jgi:hypothetical protein
MSNIISTVRATLIAVVVASPVAAFAQTASDVARLVGQEDVTFVSAAPASSDFAGAGSAADLARLIDTHGVTTNVAAVAPRGTSFGALDVARLSGVEAPVSQTVAVDGGSKIAVADGGQR